MLIELADVRRTRSRSAWSADAAFTSRWQSSKLPAIAYARTLRVRLRIEHRQLRFLPWTHPAVWIEHDDARVRHPVEGVPDRASRIARRGHEDRCRAPRDRAAPKSDAPSRARRCP